MKTSETWRNIQICRVETPAIMWVKNINIKEHHFYEEFLKFQHQLDTAFHTEDHKTNDYISTLERDKPAVVQHKSTWRRCIILDLHETNRYEMTVDVFLTDYGDQITVPAMYVRSLTAGMWSSIPYLCRRIQLVGTVPSNISWQDKDGNPKFCFKVGRYWSAASLRFVNEITNFPHICKFDPMVPYVPTSNATCLGNIYLEMTKDISNSVNCFYKGDEPLQTLENLTDLLVNCKMAVVFEEDLIEYLKQADRDSKAADGIAPTKTSAAAIEDPGIHQDIASNSVMKVNNEDARPVYDRAPFQMVLPTTLGNSLEMARNSLELPGDPILQRNTAIRTSSVASDLNDIPLPPPEVLSDCFSRSSGTSSADGSGTSSRESAASQDHFKERPTGYELKVRKNPSPTTPEIESELPSPEIDVHVSPAKSTGSSYRSDVKSRRNNDEIANKYNPNKSRKDLRPNISSLIGPMADVARLLRVYNAGEIPLGRHELMIDEADGRRDLNRNVWQLLKQMGEFMVRPLQKYMWPSILRGRSCIAIENGPNGKTLGFVIPLMSQILDMIPILRKYAPARSGPLAIIVCSNWRSVEQVAKYLDNLNGFTNLRITTVYGGMSKSSNEEDQKMMLSVEILVTTMPSLPRLGVPLLKDHLPRDDPIECISLEKCSFLVFDNFESIYKHFPALTDSLLDKWLNDMKHYETVKQVVITSKQWNDDIQKVADKISIMNPNILISSIFEAAIASKVKTRLDCCRTGPLVAQAVCDAISTYLDKKIIVFLNGCEQAERLDALLRTRAISTIRLASADRPVVKQATDMWVSSRSCVMLILEVAFIEYISSGIKDADVIIHCSVPPNKHHLGMRYSYMMNKFENVKQGQATCISHFILSSEMISGRPQIIPELERLGVDIADRGKRAYDEGIRLIKLKTATSDLCLAYKLFGSCSEPICNQRHYLTPNDEPKLVPSFGQVKLQIIEVKSASQYVARIRCYKNAKGRVINLEKVHQRVHTTLQEFYRSSEKRKHLSQEQCTVGSLCALQNQFWVRGEIANIDYSESRVSYTIRKIDEGGFEKRSINSLYQLPDDVKGIPPLAIEIVLCSIKPVDNDTHFTKYATQIASNLLLNISSQNYFTAMISFALRNTLFIREIIEIQVIAKTPRETTYLAREFIQKKLAAPNITHLQKLAIDEFDRPYNLQSQSELWLQSYKSVENPFNTNDTEPMMDIEAGEGKKLDAVSICSSSSSTVVGNPVVETNGLPVIKKSDALRALMQHVQASKSAINNTPVTKINHSEVAPSPQITANPRPVCCNSPNRNMSDEDDTISYSNFDLVTRESTSEIEGSLSSLCASNSISLPLNEVVKVEIPSIYSPKSFSVIKAENFVIIDSISNRIEAQMKKFVQFDPYKGVSGVFVAQFTDGCYYRAVVKDLQEGASMVHFVDYGERMLLSWDKIFQFPPNNKIKVPFQAINCELHGITIHLKEFNAAKKHMEDLLDSHDEWFIKPITVDETTDGLVYKVELFTKSEPEPIDVANYLVKAGYAEVTPNKPDKEELKNESAGLEKERVKRLINDRQFLYSPTDTIKEYLNEENGCLPSERASIADGAGSDSPKSRVSYLSSVVKAIRDKKRSLSVNRHQSNGVGPAVLTRPPSENGSQKLQRPAASTGIQKQGHPPSLQKTILHPTTKWRETHNMIVIRMDLLGVEAYEFDPGPNYIHFQTSRNEVSYEFREKLWSNIDSNTATCTPMAREVVIQLYKQTHCSWPRLLSCAGTVPWLRRDVSVVDDSSECSTTARRSVVGGWGDRKIKQYGGLPAGISDSDSSMGSTAISEADSEIFKFG